jgi:hypothetical protein
MEGFDASPDALALVATLTGGGDARITLDDTSGLNRYLSAPYPRSVLAYSSSTVSDISADAFAHLLAASAERSAQSYAARLDALRGRICTAYGISADTEIVFAPSGTDLEYVALALALERSDQGIHNVLLGADETGSGCIHSAHGRFFAGETALVGGVAPSLHRLGGADFAKAKSKVRSAVREIAQELVVLYQKRVNATGHSFGQDTPWQHEMEDAFPFAPTPDQRKAIDDIKSDMERAYPMDRLVCGDVGFGKTEVAVRAAFKAIQDGKQVAVLAPTTLLATQHGNTFADRFAGFPIRVEVLSRFLTQKEAKKVIEGLKTGEIDCIIGTHRLLQDSIEFKDLGLLIVDEEQRFGVQAKEAMKKMKHNVDVLTLSATPIPRTLEMSLVGIRDLSLLQTPPADRQPILTFVGEYDERVAVEAIRRELLREGQVFWVHNRVTSIDTAAQRLRDSLLTT